MYIKINTLNICCTTEMNTQMQKKIYFSNTFMRQLIEFVGNNDIKIKKGFLFLFYVF